MPWIQVIHTNLNESDLHSLRRHAYLLELRLSIKSQERVKMTAKIEPNFKTPHLLSREEIIELQKKYSYWKVDDERKTMTRALCFKNFIDAFSFMTRIAFFAEQMNHHPQWSNVYKNVTITLTTHDCDGLSDLDIKLAAIIDETVTLFSH